MSSEPASQTPRKRTTTTLVLGPQGLPRGDALEASLVGISGAAFGHRFLVGRDLARLGRDPECEIRIDDGNVSRFHAEIVRLGTRFVLRDTGARTEHSAVMRAYKKRSWLTAISFELASPS